MTWAFISVACIIVYNAFLSNLMILLSFFSCCKKKLPAKNQDNFSVPVRRSLYRNKLLFWITAHKHTIIIIVRVELAFVEVIFLLLRNFTTSKGGMATIVIYFWWKIWVTFHFWFQLSIIGSNSIAQIFWTIWCFICSPSIDFQLYVERLHLLKRFFLPKCITTIEPSICLPTLQRRQQRPRKILLSEKITIP